jgi:hypothetical protein
MEAGIKERVIQWAQSGGDFQAGLSLFLTMNRNVFYIRNIESKGVLRGMATLVNEFANKTKMPIGEIRGLIEEGKKCNYNIANNTNFGRIPRIENYTNLDELNKPPIITKPADLDRLSPEFMAEAKERQRRIVKLREEFPFLARKDCPDELAILVNKMITAYGEYMKGHELLYDVDTKDLDTCYKAGKEVVDAYILNRQIWDELNYYKINGKVLGNLPVFRVRKLRDKFEAMNTVALVRAYTNNIPRRISYCKAQLASVNTANKDAARKRMAEAEQELEVIQAILRERGEI